jgi:Calcineurin-like phosphoesterase
MPDVSRLLTTLRRALVAFRATPGRRGRIVHLADAADILVAGDLHGNLDNFKLLLRAADLGKHPRRHFVLQEVIHGSFTYPLGGDKSHQLLDVTAALKCQYPDRVHFLLGNHELAQWTGRRIAKNDENLLELFKAGVDLAYGEQSNEVYAAYLDLFAAVPLAVRTANRIFLSHSLPNSSRLATFDPAVLERDTHDETDLGSGGAVHSLVWGRDTSTENVAAFLQKVDADLLVTGHIPCDNGFEVPNDRQVILDSLGAPAAYGLFPADRPLSHAELVAGVKLL